MAKYIENVTKELTNKKYNVFYEEIKKKIDYIKNLKNDFLTL